MAGCQTTASLMMIQGGSLCADINKNSFSPVYCDSESAAIVAAFCLVVLSANT